MADNEGCVVAGGVALPHADVNSAKLSLIHKLTVSACLLRLSQGVILVVRLEMIEERVPFSRQPVRLLSKILAACEENCGTGFLPVKPTGYSPVPLTLRIFAAGEDFITPQDSEPGRVAPVRLDTSRL